MSRDLPRRLVLCSRASVTSRHCVSAITIADTDRLQSAPKASIGKTSIDAKQEVFHPVRNGHGFLFSQFELWLADDIRRRLVFCTFQPEQDGLGYLLSLLSHLAEAICDRQFAASGLSQRVRYCS
jgi:hypothetical protein